MPEDKKKLKKREDKPKKKNLKDDTKKGILAILFFVLAIIVIFSRFGLAGVAGDYILKIVTTLFGLGFYLFPLALILSGVALLRSLREEVLGVPLIGSALFLVSFLSMLELLFSGQQSGSGGGYVGVAFLWPFNRAFGAYVSFVILLALIIVGVLIAFNISFGSLLKKAIKFFGLGKFVKEEPGTLAASAPTINEGGKVEYVADAEKLKETSGGLIGRVFGKKDKPEEKKEIPIAPAPASGSLASEPSKENKGKDNYKTDFKLPSLDLLESDSGKPTSGDIQANSNIIKRTLQNFNIEVEMAEVNIGPTVTQYTLRPAQGIKLSKIVGLSNDLALALAAHPIRIEAPIPGRSLVGIELPNKSVTMVRLRNLISRPEFSKNGNLLTLALGRDVAGNPFFAGLEKMPHLLIAGATGTGKTIGLNSLIVSLLYRLGPDMLKMILVDPKRVEFPIYSGIPHLLTPPIVSPDKTVNALRWAVTEMERRFEILSEASTRDIIAYNERRGKDTPPMPYIVIIVDELADLMASHGREVEASIVRLAQMARAVGIHLILATQRPSVEVITGLIKANITTRIAFQVASQIDSRTILDTSGAEKLLGKGDMLFLSADASKPRRLQGAFVSDMEVRRMVDYLKESGEPEYEEQVTDGPAKKGGGFGGVGGDADDDLLEDAKEVVIQAGKASASLLQRRLRVGYARAARLLDLLEDQGAIGPADGAKPRDVLLRNDEKDFGEPGGNKEF